MNRTDYRLMACRAGVAVWAGKLGQYSGTHMRKILVLLSICILGLWCIGADQPPADINPLMPTVLTKQMIEAKTPTAPVHRVNFGGREYLVLIKHFGYGVPHNLIGIYASMDDSTFRLCLFAESWVAGWIQPTLDVKTGILELREQANSKLKGEVVLTCNLKTIGTQHSTQER